MTAREIRRRPTRRVLPIVASMLFLSALVRLGAGAGQVLAEEGATPAEPAAPVQGTAELLAAFQSREERVAAKEAAIAARLEQLHAAEAELATQIAALEEAEASLSATLAIADSAAQEDVARLARVYEAMKPQDAAALFAAMDPGFSSGFLGLMRPEAAAAVMTNLDPQVAYAISAVLAGRNALAPTE